MTTTHKIVGTEVYGRRGLLPGYGALTIGQTKPFHWNWFHTTAVASGLIAGLTVLGMNGLLP